MKCPLCNSDMVPVIDHDVCAIHSNKCMCCNAVVSTDEDQENHYPAPKTLWEWLLNFQKKALPVLILYNVIEKFIQNNCGYIINGYVVVDAKLIGGEDTLRNINADMFTTWGIEKPLGSHVIFIRKYLTNRTPYYNMSTRASI